MAGQATHGYDVVMELSEATYEDLLRVIFDTDDFLLTTVLTPLGIPVPPGIGFDATVSFDRPAGIPQNAVDAVDIRVTLGPNGSFGSLRIVTGVVAERFDPNVSVLRLDLKNRLWITEIAIVNLPIPGINDAFATLLRQKVSSIILLALPATEGTTDPLVIGDIDARIIDDTSAADKDASALMLTFGSGSPGDRNAFTASFLTGNGSAGLMASMDWICRNISPAIDTGLGGHDAFHNCHLDSPIDMGDDVSLTELSVTPEDGHLQIRAKVQKSGFCYTATGTVGAKVTVNVSDGDLHVDVDVDDPDLDVDIPWYCYLAAGILGALGGVLIGAVYAIIGGILLPIIVYLAKSVLEGAVNSAAETVASALNASIPAIDLTVPDIKAPILDVDFRFSDAAIDDVEIDGRMVPVDTAPIRVSGQVTIPDGQVLDLDSGRVGGRDLPGADLTVVGTGAARRLTIVCGAAIARTTLTGFDDLFRAAVYPWNYRQITSFPLTEVGIFFPPFVSVPFRQIFGMQTNEARWAAFQVTGASASGVTVRYLTWEKPTPTVQIAGAFACSKARFDILGVIDPDAVFEASGTLRAALARTEPAAQSPQVLARSAAGVDAATDLRTRLALTSAAIEALPPTNRTIGTFTRTRIDKRVPYARFRANTTGFGPGLHARWEIDGIALPDPSGDITTPGGTHLHYTTAGISLALDVSSSAAVEMRVSVSVADDAARTGTAERCVRFEPTCTRVVRTIPTLPAFSKRYAAEFGVMAAPGRPQR